MLRFDSKTTNNNIKFSAILSFSPSLSNIITTIAIIIKKRN